MKVVQDGRDQAFLLLHAGGGFDHRLGDVAAGESKRISQLVDGLGRPPQAREALRWNPRPFRAMGDEARLGRERRR